MYWIWGPHWLISFRFLRPDFNQHTTKYTLICHSNLLSQGLNELWFYRPASSDSMTVVPFTRCLQRCGGNTEGWSSLIGSFLSSLIVWRGGAPLFTGAAASASFWQFCWFCPAFWIPISLWLLHQFSLLNTTLTCWCTNNCLWTYTPAKFTPLNWSRQYWFIFSKNSISITIS